MRRLWLSTVFVCLHAALVSAQGPPLNKDHIQAIAFQYSHLSVGGDHLDGWQTEYSWNRPSRAGTFGLPSIVGFDTSFSQHYGSHDRVDPLPFGQDDPTVRRTTFLAGAHIFPIVPIPVYLRALVGYSRRTESFVDASGQHVSRSSDSPVVGAGAGLTIPVRKRLAIRVIQIDYLRFTNDRDVKNGLRISTGVSIVW
jgi:hypothetical protein